MPAYSFRDARKCIAALGLAAAVASTAAHATVSLEWRPGTQSVCLGDTVRIGLYAVSDSALNQNLSAVDLVFTWDPAFLDLVGVDQTGAAPSQGAGFFLNDPFGLNEAVPPQDGNGLMTLFAQLGTPIAATPSGTLLTTFVFSAIQETTGPTFVHMLPSGGAPPVNTTVWAATPPNTPITGSLDTARVGIVFQVCPADIDDDEDVDIQDLAYLLAAFGVDDGGDQDCDGDTDLGDLALLLSRFGLPCD